MDRTNNRDSEVEDIMENTDSLEEKLEELEQLEDKEFARQADIDALLEREK